MILLSWVIRTFVCIITFSSAIGFAGLSHICSVLYQLSRSILGGQVLIKAMCHISSHDYPCYHPTQSTDRSEITDRILCLAFVKWLWNLIKATIGTCDWRKKPSSHNLSGARLIESTADWNLSVTDVYLHLMSKTSPDMVRSVCCEVKRVKDLIDDLVISWISKPGCPENLWASRMG